MFEVCPRGKLTKSDDRKAGIRYVNHEYDIRTEVDNTMSCYQLIVTITISTKVKVSFEEELLIF